MSAKKPVASVRAHDRSVRAGTEVNLRIASSRGSTRSSRKLLAEQPSNVPVGAGCAHPSRKTTTRHRRSVGAKDIPRVESRFTLSSTQEYTTLDATDVLTTRSMAGPATSAEKLGDFRHVWRLWRNARS